MFQCYFQLFTFCFISIVMLTVRCNSASYVYYSLFLIFLFGGAHLLHLFTYSLCYLIFHLKKSTFILLSTRWVWWHNTASYFCILNLFFFFKHFIWKNLLSFSQGGSDCAILLHNTVRVNSRHWTLCKCCRAGSLLDKQGRFYLFFSFSISLSNINMKQGRFSFIFIGPR